MFLDPVVICKVLGFLGTKVAKAENQRTHYVIPQSVIQGFIMTSLDILGDLSCHFLIFFIQGLTLTLWETPGTFLANLLKFLPRTPFVISLS